jgi:non-canonical purine NTP pyrophosphatase (RdgB/HAM1 family)
MTLSEICNQAQESAAKAVTMAGHYDGEQFLFCEGITQGTIAPAPKGENGFGWDSLFIPSGSLQTPAEMSLEAKKVFSSRRKAFEFMKERLDIA